MDKEKSLYFPGEFEFPGRHVNLEQMEVKNKLILYVNLMSAILCKYFHAISTRLKKKKENYFPLYNSRVLSKKAFLQHAQL